VAPSHAEARLIGRLWQLSPSTTIAVLSRLAICAPAAFCVGGSRFQFPRGAAITAASRTSKLGWSSSSSIRVNTLRSP